MLPLRLARCSPRARPREADCTTASGYTTNLCAGRRIKSPTEEGRKYAHTAPRIVLTYHLWRWQRNCQRICCILNSDKMRRVECPSPPSHAEQRRLIREGGDGRDGHECSSGNFLIKELSTLSCCAAALWIGNHVSKEGSFIASCSSDCIPCPPSPPNISWV